MKIDICSEVEFEIGKTMSGEKILEIIDCANDNIISVTLSPIEINMMIKTLERLKDIK